MLLASAKQMDEDLEKTAIELCRVAAEGKAAVADAKAAADKAIAAAAREVSARAAAEEAARKAESTAAAAVAAQAVAEAAASTAFECGFRTCRDRVGAALEESFATALPAPSNGSGEAAPIRARKRVRRSAYERAISPRLNASAATLQERGMGPWTRGYTGAFQQIVAEQHGVVLTQYAARSFVQLLREEEATVQQAEEYLSFDAAFLAEAAGDLPDGGDLPDDFLRSTSSLGPG